MKLRIGFFFPLMIKIIFEFLIIKIDIKNGIDYLFKGVVLFDFLREFI